MIRPWIFGIVVFACALVMRLALLHTARFGGDEALFFKLGMDIVEAKDFPLLGTHITDGNGRLPGPAFLYLMALPLFVERAPEAQYVFVEILGAATVWLFWCAMRRSFGERGAFFAALLMAFSPWSTLYADRTWNPNVLPFFVVLALLAAVRLCDRPHWLALFIPACAIMPQLHMSAPVAWAGLAVLVAPAVARWQRRWLALGLLIAFALYAPLLVHEVQTGFANTRSILSETVGATERHPTSFLWIPVYALRFLTLDATYHELSGYWGGADEVACLRAAFMGTPPRPFHPLRVFELTCSIALAALALVRTRTAAWRSPWVRAFATALLVNMVLLGLAGKQVFGHYVTNLFPFVFVVYAALGATLATTTALMRGVVVALGLVFCLGGAEVTLLVSRRVDARIGLEVHRRTLEKIHGDGRDPVRLDFGYFSSTWDWAIFSSRAMKHSLHFDRAAARRYRLVEKHKPMPAGSYREGPIDVGHALLYRVK